MLQVLPMKKKAEKTVDTHLYMPQWLLLKVKELARENRRTMTAEITIVLEQYVKERNGSKERK